MSRPSPLLRLVGLLTASLSLSLLTGCESKLPGPLECEEMSLRGLGRSREEIQASPAARQVTARLVHGCLTTPFDQEAVACVNAGHSLRRCADELATREPERVPALNELLSDLSKNLARLRERRR